MASYPAGELFGICNKLIAKVAYKAHHSNDQHNAEDLKESDKTALLSGLLLRHLQSILFPQIVHSIYISFMLVKCKLRQK